MTDDRIDERLDLSALDPRRDPAAHERAVAAIMREAGPRLVRRRAAVTPIGQVAQWWRPMLALAAALALAALGVLTRVAPAAAASEAATPGVAQSLGIPATLSTWLGTDDTPSPAQVFAAFEEDQ